MQSKENQWRPKFVKWVKEKKQLPTCAYELKHTRGKEAFTLSELKEHQRIRLDLASSSYGVQYTIPNSSKGNKFVDGVWFVNGNSYVAINFIDIACVISWNKLKRYYSNDSTVKSLSVRDACILADHIIVDNKYLQK